MLYKCLSSLGVFEFYIQPSQANGRSVMMIYCDICHWSVLLMVDIFLCVTMNGWQLHRRKMLSRFSKMLKFNYIWNLKLSVDWSMTKDLRLHRRMLHNDILNPSQFACFCLHHDKRRSFEKDRENFHVSCRSFTNAIWDKNKHKKESWNLIIHP